jgi:hypothetical protein
MESGEAPLLHQTFQPIVHFPQQRLYFFPEPHGQRAFNAGNAGGTATAATGRRLTALKCCTSIKAVTPTRVAQTSTNPMHSVLLNMPESKNQITPTVQIAIQVTPYQGLLIFFMIQGFTRAEPSGQYLVPTLVGLSVRSGAMLL